MILGLFCLFTGKINAQVFVNGNLSTGPTASTGDAAPAGFNWTEVQAGNANAGFAANITAGFSVADDFTIAAGTWGLTKFTCYAYSTGYAGATSPFNDIRLQIFNTNPSVGNPAPIFGDLTTNRFTASSTASLYRIFNATPGTTRQVWKIEANISTSLTAGTYWVEWQVGTALASNFSPASTVVGTVTQPGNNAIQHTIAGNTWAPILDGPAAADPQDMPFQLDYTTSVCAGTPAPGATLSSAATVCPATPFTLSLQNGTGGSGVTYQWQSSSNGTTFTDITGATNSSYTTTLTAATFYQAVVSCSGTPGTSTPVQVQLTPASGCYCVPTPTDCTDGDLITNVTVGTLNNTSTCGPSGFSNYTTDASITVPDLVQGIANPMSVSAGGGLFTETVGVWIDYDRSGSFDASEFTYFGNTTGGTLNANINVPATAALGIARMRVRVRFNTALTGTNSCTIYTYGETEDYNVNIIPCVQGVFNTQPVSQSIECGNGVTFTSSATGTFLSYQWQQNAGTGGPWTNLSNGGDVSGATSNTLSIANIDGSKNGYQYRVVISGGCTAVDFSNVATLTVTPLVVTVNPASYSTCSPISSSAPIALTITNVSGSSSSTTTPYPSGPINLAIPDLDDVAGVTSSVTVPALPPGAVITGATVTLNVNHGWVGDLIFALKAPNGNVLNLDYALTSTGGPGVTTGFTGTVISSTGTATLVSGTDPWTGIFAPDAVATPVAGIPTAPTTLSATNANVFNFAGLYSVPDGVWTLGVYDYASPDAGTLLDWTLTLTYSTTAVVPFTGTWSPATGLFTDANGTTPYVANTQANTVYAAPAASTVYTVTVVNTICPTDPVDVPVNILRADPVVSVAASNGTSLYPGLVTTVTATLSAPSTTATYQWFANGVALPGATASTYLAGVESIGDLTVEVTDPSTCSGLAIGSITLTDSSTSPLYVYPNPTTGIFQVRFSNGINDILSAVGNVTVYDSKGAKVLTQRFANIRPYDRVDIDLSKQPKGVYVVNLTDASGKSLQSARVVVQ